MVGPSVHRSVCLQNLVFLASLGAVASYEVLTSLVVTEKGNEKRPESKPVPTVEEMIEYARDKGWTNMGEIFSCVAMKR